MLRTSTTSKNSGSSGFKRGPKPSWKRYFKIVVPKTFRFPFIIIYRIIFVYWLPSGRGSTYKKKTGPSNNSFIYVYLKGVTRCRWKILPRGTESALVHAARFFGAKLLWAKYSWCGEPDETRHEGLRKGPENGEYDQLDQLWGFRTWVVL